MTMVSINTPQDLFTYNFLRLMEERGYTQSSLADAMDIAAPSVSNYMNGKRYPGSDKLQEFCTFFNVPAAEFFKTPADLMQDANKGKTELALTLSPGLSAEAVADRLSKFAIKGKNKIFSIRIADASMAPTLQHGDLVTCSFPSASDLDGKMVLVKNGSAIQVGRIYKTGDRYMFLVAGAIEPVYIDRHDPSKQVLVVLLSMERVY